MEVYEKINQILLTRTMSKRDFATKLRAIEPKLKSTGEVPTEKAIYGYLNGTSNLKIELIPYIAETLNIKEQVLFDDTSLSKYKLNKPDTACVKEPLINYSSKEDKDKEKLIALLSYAPNTLIINMIEKLEKIKEISDLD
ncbi:hypothetical protein A9Q76_01405 [Arcobacter sp. 31_11_sub10_T18]|nr:hypothetical protein A9Q76_01405 [Arcobacter sp. 31_11_sub10_T18]